MAFFTQTLAPWLYTAASGSEDRGWLGYLLPATTKPPGPGIALSDAFPGAALQGSFLFAPAAPDLSSADKANAFAAAVSALVPAGGRAMLWLAAPTQLTPQSVVSLPISTDGARLASSLKVPLTQQLVLVAANGLSLSPTDGEPGIDILAATQQSIQFQGMPTLQTSPLQSVSLLFSGSQRGCLRFAIGIQRSSMYHPLRWGFQAVIPYDKPYRQNLAAWYPLADANNPNGADMLGFTAYIDPIDVANSHRTDRTFLAFLGKNSDGSDTVLASYYRTSMGQVVNLRPTGTLTRKAAWEQTARLLFTACTPDGQKGTDFVLAPAGDFVLTVDGAQSGTRCDLVCGLSATETAGFLPQAGTYPGDRLRFATGQAAFALHYPFRTASATSAPIDPDAMPLTGDYTSSWAMMLRPPGTGADPDTSVYISQPRGASLYGQDQQVYSQYQSLLGFMQPGYLFPQDRECYYPLLPYAGVVPDEDADHVTFNHTQFEQVERQVLAPARRAAISRANPKPYAGQTAAIAGLAAADEYNATTPAGLVATIGNDGTWRSVYLGQNPPAGRAMAFTWPAAGLQQAFQTEGLFLVGANASALGAAAAGVPADPPAPGAAFYNAIRIQDWEITANVGAHNRYSDYNNVVIVKGRKGKLQDLVRNPSLWTQSAAFSVPNTDGTADPSQLVILSQWLQDYLDKAQNESSPYFAKFQSILANENWTGILVLKADITALPQDLTGLLGGIDASRFNAHHLGIAITQIDGTTVSPQKTSSMFGLVYYVDVNYDEKTAQPVAPPAGAQYDFRVLTLKALFENSAVKQFQSLAQLTMNQLFSEPVSGMAPAAPYNCVILDGAYQHQDGKSSYSLSTPQGQDTSFLLGSSVLSRVELLKAQFTTVGESNGQVNSRFDLLGYLNFGLVPANSGTGNVDLFSFGTPAGAQPAPRQGLHFSALGINMSFPKTTPASRTFDFDASKLSFDVSNSSPRPGCLYQNLELSLDGLVSGTGDSPPTSQGYLPVSTNAALGGLNGPWYGLKFRLNLGTPGELAGKIKLTSYLLAAWSPGTPGGTPTATIGLQLPGTGGGGKLLSLQGVLQLSLGDIRLVWLPQESAFLLKLSNIALKFLGMLKLPPNGATSFYLFGNPANDGTASDLGWYAVYNKGGAKAPAPSGR